MRRNPTPFGDPTRTSLTILALTLCIGLASVSLADTAIPDRFHPARDEGLVSATSPVDGRQWSAWTYGQRAESDIAVSFLGDDGFWSDPLLIGADDGIQQTQPALAIDPDGNVYVAWAEPTTGRVFVASHAFGASSWSTPRLVNDVKGHGSSPALMVAVGRRLIVGYWINSKVRLVEFRLVPRLVQMQMSDGPDPVGQSADDDLDGLPGEEDENPFDDDGVMADLEYVGQVRRQGNNR